MKYFVTGATGFIGGHVARQLRSQGHEVVALVRDPQRAGDLQQAGVQLHAGDVTEPGCLAPGMAGCDGVFHLAGWYKIGTRDKRTGQAINIDGTRNMLQAMQEAKIARGVYTSTCAVFSDTHGKMPDESYRFTGQHISEYDRTKAAAHDIALEYIARGLPLIIVQPGVVYGPGDTSAVGSALVQFLQRKLPMLPKETEYCWAYVDDIAAAHILAMDKGRPGESYIIAGPRYNFIAAMQLAARLTGIPAPTTHVSPFVLKGMAAVMKVIEAVFPVPASYSSEYMRVSAGASYLGDNSKARKELGYTPRSLEQGLAETLRFEMARLGMPIPASLAAK